MNIHPLWLICILVRSILILVIRYFNNNKYLKNIFTFILALIGFGFIFKSLAGSNNEIQVRKVFWHETRLVHGILYILASYCVDVLSTSLWGTTETMLSGPLATADSALRVPHHFGQFQRDHPSHYYFYYAAPPHFKS